MDYYINGIVENSELSEESVKDLIEEKKIAFNGAINDIAAASMVSNDLKVSIPDYIIPEVKTEVTGTEAMTSSIIVQPARNSMPIVEKTAFPSEAEVLFLINRRKFVKEQLIDREDLKMIGKTMFLKKTGTQKYINAFGISIEILSSEVYSKDGDIVAEYRVKAITPSGQFVIADGTRTKKEYYRAKYGDFGKYNLHILKATARTRAIHIAVSDLVGYGELSLSSLSENDKNESIPEKVFHFQNQGE